MRYSATSQTSSGPQGKGSPRSETIFGRYNCEVCDFCYGVKCAAEPATMGQDIASSMDVKEYAAEFRGKRWHCSTPDRAT
jgi:hypothetical protein